MSRAEYGKAIGENARESRSFPRRLLRLVDKLGEDRGGDDDPSRDIPSAEIDMAFRVDPESSLARVIDERVAGIQPRIETDI